jgi:hypothetical protein
MVGPMPGDGVIEALTFIFHGPGGTGSGNLLQYGNFSSGGTGWTSGTLQMNGAGTQGTWGADQGLVSFAANACTVTKHATNQYLSGAVKTQIQIPADGIYTFTASITSGWLSAWLSTDGVTFGTQQYSNYGISFGHWLSAGTYWLAFSEGNADAGGAQGVFTNVTVYNAASGAPSSTTWTGATFTVKLNGVATASAVLPPTGTIITSDTPYTWPAPIQFKRGDVIEILPGTWPYASRPKTGTLTLWGKTYLSR